MIKKNALFELSALFLRKKKTFFAEFGQKSDEICQLLKKLKKFYKNILAFSKVNKIFSEISQLFSKLRDFCKNFPILQNSDKFSDENPTFLHFLSLFLL